MTGPRVEICGAIAAGEDEDRDCFCFLDEGHDCEHECAAVGCGHQWTSRQIGAKTQT